jgi:hypothetical protein
MSYINQLTLTSLALNSEAYGATSNGTITTDATGDINLNPLTGGAVYASTNLITPQIQFGSSTGPSITSDSSGNLYTPSTFVTQTILLSSSSGPQIQADPAGDINLYPITGTVNFGGGTAQTIASGDNLTIECGSSSSITLSGDTSVSGTTTLGTNSSAISNIQFGSYTFSNIVQADAGPNNYHAGSAINLPFTPTAITFGVNTNNTGIVYQSTVTYEDVGIPSSAPSGTVYSFEIYLYLPDSNGDNSVDYYVNWIAIA